MKTYLDLLPDELQEIIWKEAHKIKMNRINMIIDDIFSNAILEEIEYNRNEPFIDFVFKSLKDFNMMSKNWNDNDYNIYF